VPTRRLNRRARKPTLADYGRAFLTHSKPGRYGLTSAERIYRRLFGDDEDAAREFWREHKDTLNVVRDPDDPAAIELWGYARKPGTRHPLWWKFEAREPKPANDEAEFSRLYELGALTDREVQLLRAQAIEANRQHMYNPWHAGWRFRRSWQWWLFCSPEPRNEQETEAAQLIRLDVLDGLEREILGNPAKVVSGGLGFGVRTRFHYLTEDEQKLLGLPASHWQQTRELVALLERDPAGELDRAARREKGEADTAENV